jgi:HlyD family secretion protein
MDRTLALKRFAPLVAIAIAVLVAIVWFTRTRGHSDELTAHGNVDLRQVEVPFNASERVLEVLVEEGAHVAKGQVLARLDTSRLEPQVAQAEAQMHAQEQVVTRLHNGNRPQEIAQAKANVQSAQADADQARAQYERIAMLFEQSHGRAVSPQDRDQAQAASAAAQARLEVAKKSLDLMLVGARKEDIAEAEARLRANQANVALLKQQLKDAQLLAPADAVVRTRLIEPGELASPQKSAFSLAIVDPKWIRAYVGEMALGKVRPNMQAAITVDSFPNRRFEGWVGFISPTAEFTPKTVQTEELRSSLVYEVRVFVKDPKDELRLGMPATVHFLSQTDTRTAGQ